MSTLRRFSLLWLVGAFVANACFADDDLTLTTKRHFYLPVRIPDELNNELRELQFFVSTDKGKSWQHVSSISPRNGVFEFKAPRIGLYWFAVAVIEKGKKADVNKLTPGKKVRVIEIQGPERPYALCELVDGYLRVYHQAVNPRRHVLEVLDELLTATPMSPKTLVRRSPHFAHAFGHIAHADSDLVRAYEDRFVSTNDHARNILLAAFRVCGDKQTLRLLKRWHADDSFANVKADITNTIAFLRDGHKLPRDVSASTTHDLDLLWADFLVTGASAPLNRILDVFERKDALRRAIDRSLADKKSLKRLVAFLHRKALLARNVINPGELEVLVVLLAKMAKREDVMSELCKISLEQPADIQHCVSLRRAALEALGRIKTLESGKLEQVLHNQLQNRTATSRQRITLLLEGSLSEASKEQGTSE